MLKRLAGVISDKKGFNLLALDVRGESSMTDYFLIAEGNVNKHVQSLARAVEEVLKEEGVSSGHIEGAAEGDWIVIDCFQVIIHLFTPSSREYYRLERVWEKGKIVDLELGDG